jgi:hypothetical protein
MSDIKSTLHANHVKSIKNFRTIPESGAISKADTNLDNVRHGISADIVKLKSELDHAVWQAVVNKNPAYQEVLQLIETDVNNPDKGFCYIDSSLIKNVRFDLYVDTESTEYFKKLKSFCEQYSNLESDIEQHQKSREEIEIRLYKVLLNGAEELNREEIDIQKETNEYQEKKQEIDFQIKLKELQIRAIREYSNQLTDEKFIKITRQNIGEVKTSVKNLLIELEEFLVNLALVKNPTKIHISNNSFAFYLKSNSEFIEYQKKMQDLELKKEQLLDEINSLREEFENNLKETNLPISSIKDPLLKRKLAKEAAKMSKSPMMPFYELKEYITPKSFVILPQSLFEETISYRHNNQFDNKDNISKDEKEQFFGDDVHEVDCDDFGKVKVSAKTKGEQKFLHCEFLDESVKISDYDSGEDSAILNHNGNDYRLYFKLTKKVIDKNIRLSLNLQHVGTTTKPQQYTICNKETIFELSSQFSSPNWRN